MQPPERGYVKCHLRKRWNKQPPAPFFKAFNDRLPRFKPAINQFDFGTPRCTTAPTMSGVFYIQQHNQRAGKCRRMQACRRQRTLALVRRHATTGVFTMIYFNMQGRALSAKQANSKTLSSFLYLPPPHACLLISTIPKMHWCSKKKLPF